MPRPRRPDRGVTLVGIIVFATLVTLLTSLLIVFFRSSRGSKGPSRSHEMVRVLAGACEVYKLDFGAYPPSAEGTRGLRRCLGSERRVAAGGVDTRKPPLIEFPKAWLGKDGTIVDPWGNELRYQAPGRRNPGGVDLWSAGPNGRDELDPAHPDFDDVTSWLKD
jgi:type II secretory pathway pseudopilin PulG